MFHQKKGLTPILRPPTTTQLQTRQPNKRGRGRLLKCEKHRRWKKRCPVDCPDKPLHPMYLDGDDDEEEGDEDEEQDDDEQMSPGPMMGSLGDRGSMRNMSHMAPPLQPSPMVVQPLQMMQSPYSSQPFSINPMQHPMSMSVPSMQYPPMQPMQSHMHPPMMGMPHPHPHPPPSIITHPLNTMNMGVPPYAMRPLSMHPGK